MDVSVFSDDNFEVKDWINRTFKSSEAQENRDIFVSSLVKKLQLYVQQVNGAVEDTSQQILHSLPRVMRDTDVLLHEAVSLREMMRSVRQEVLKVEQNTGQSMAALERIDQIKSELQAAKQALHEADNWTILTSDLEEVFESGDIENISKKLVSMQQSLNVLANVPDYEERKLTLDGLKNRLEAIASPLLVQAFTSASIEQTCLFVRVFTAIDRLPQLFKYYHKCQKGYLLQQWGLLLETEQDDTVADWLLKFYDQLLSSWHEQVKWCNQVFSGTSALETLVQLFADVLSNLDPSPNSCIDAALKQQTDQLEFLMRLKQNTKHFAGNMQVAVDSTLHGKNIDKSITLVLAQAVYYPYRTYISKYASYEQQCLLQQLDSMKCVKDDLMETIQSLGISIHKAISLAVDANERCIQFTEGCGYCGLLTALKSFFTNYVEKFKIALRWLDKQKKEQEDWNLFQMCLTLLQNTGELLLQVRQFSEDLKRSITDSVSIINGQKENAFSQFKCLLLNEEGKKDLDALINSVHNEETSLLESVLNTINKLCGDVLFTTFQVIFAPVSRQLEQISSAPIWKNTGTSITPDLPDFSFAPQEYITQIGQYLMTLPQHLEPFLLQDNPALNVAVQVADAEYDAISQASGVDLADVFLNIMARNTCQTYLECVLAIAELDSSGCKQLATDIDYLGNVLEDLGLSVSDHLQQMGQLLRLNGNEYPTRSSGYTPRLVAAVRQMRNITSS